MPPWAGHLADLGYISVGLFFILSGFVLTYAYAGGSDPVEKSDFYRNRFARIYPVYALAMLIALPKFARDYEILGLPRGEFGLDVLLRFTLVHAWHPGTMKYYNVPSWSLSCEAFFYLLFPFLLPTVKGILPRNVFRSLVCVLALAAFAPAMYEWAYPGSTPASESYRLLLVKFHPLVRLPEFLAGMLLGRLFAAHPIGPVRPDRWLLAAAATVVGAAALGMPYVLLHTAGLAAPFAAIVWVLAYGKGRVATVLASKPMVVLGESSYALYICHVPLFFILIGQAAASGIDVRTPGFALGAVLAILAISIALHYAFERPLRKLLRTPEYPDYDSPAPSSPSRGL